MACPSDSSTGPTACDVRVYSREGCCLCEDVLEMLAELRRRYAFTVRTVDVDTDADLRARHGERVPVVVVNGREIGAGRIPPAILEQRIARIAERA